MKLILNLSEDGDGGEQNEKQSNSEAQNSKGHNVVRKRERILQSSQFYQDRPRLRAAYVAFFFAAFRRLAHAFFMAELIFALNSVSSAGGVIAARTALFLEGAFGAAASAFAASIAAQRRFCPSAILRRAAALTFLFVGAAGSDSVILPVTQSGALARGSTVAGGRPGRFFGAAGSPPPSASMAA